MGGLLAGRLLTGFGLILMTGASPILAQDAPAPLDKKVAYSGLKAIGEMFAESLDKANRVSGPDRSIRPSACISMAWPP